MLLKTNTSFGCCFLFLGDHSTECTQGFFSRAALESYNAVIDRQIRSHASEQRLIPNLRFTCNGTITKWIIGAHRPIRPPASIHPQLQIWRRPPRESAYVRAGYTNITDLALTVHQNVYEVVPSSELRVQAGDALGFFQPSGEESTLLLYYLQEFDGSMNYRKESSIPLTSGFVLRTNLVEDVDLPLVTVEMGKGVTCGYILKDENPALFFRWHLFEEL